ncbi:Cytochrome P450, partial [Sesbania bispinosa]
MDSLWVQLQGKKNNMQYPLPPGDLGWPFLGNMFTFLKAFKSDPDSFINNLVSRTGMYRSHLFGSPSIIVCSPETCRKVLTNEEQFRLGYPASTMALVGKRSFHGISNAEHKRYAVKHLEDMSSMNSPCEFLREMRKFAFEVFTTIFIASDDDSHVDLGLVQDLYTHLNRGMKSLAINLPGFAFHKALKIGITANKCTKVDEAAASLMDRKRRNKNMKTKTKKDMMDLLMEVKDEEGKQLEDEDIIDILLIFLLAGHESSAHGVLWTIIYLIDHPHVLHRAK